MDPDLELYMGLEGSSGVCGPTPWAGQGDNSAAFPNMWMEVLFQSPFLVNYQVYGLFLGYGKMNVGWELSHPS